MKTVVLNFTQPGNKEVLLLLAPDDMDVQAEIAECRTRCHRSSFSRECRSSTVYNWLIDRGCIAPDEPPVMIDGWHEPPMTRPRSENCNVPLVEPYIRMTRESREAVNGDWVEEASRQIGVSDIPDTYADPWAMAASRPIDADFITPSESQIGGNYRPIAELTQEECAARAIRRPVRTETVPNNIYQTMLPGRPIEWRPFARNMEIAVEPGDPLPESSGSYAPQMPRGTNPVSWPRSPGCLDLDEMRELARRAAGISEARAAALSPPPTTRDQDQQ